MLTARNSSTARPSVRTKLIVPPNFNCLQNCRDSSQESFRDSGESLRRVSYIKVVQIVAQFSFARHWLRFAREAFGCQQRFDFARCRLSRIDQSNIVTDRFGNNITQDRVMSA